MKKFFLERFSWRDFPGNFFVQKFFRRDFFHNHGGRRSIAGTAQHSMPISKKESPFQKKFSLIWLSSIFTKNWTHLQFYKRNPFKIESDQKKSLPKNWTHLQFYKRNPRKNYSEQKKINPEIWSQKYPLGSSSWRPFLKKVKGFPCKIEGEFFQWDFSWKLKAILKIFTWISFVKLKVSSIFW